MKVPALTRNFTGWPTSHLGRDIYMDMSVYQYTDIREGECILMDSYEMDWDRRMYYRGKLNYYRNLEGLIGRATPKVTLVQKFLSTLRRWLG